MEQEIKGSETKEVGRKPKLTPVFDLFEKSYREYFKHVKKFIEIYLRGLVGFIPFIAAILAFGLLAMTNAFSVNLLLRLLGAIVVFLTALWAIYYGIRIRTSMILLVNNDYGAAKDNFLASKKYFWGYVWISILSTVIIGLWSILLIIPGLIFAVYYLLSCYSFFGEGYRGMWALRRSLELTKGYWWAVCGRVLFIAMIAIAINIILTTPLNYMESSDFFFIAYSIFIDLIWALISPIVIIYAYKIFRDLLQIKGESKRIKKPAQL